MSDSFTLENVGQIKKAHINFGDLTVLVGNQATGKSIFLQLFKLFQDFGQIKHELNRFGYSSKDPSSFLSLYLGEGMQNIIGRNSVIKKKGKQIDFQSRFLKSRKSQTKNFYIPAQRVMMMEQGFAKSFTSFDISFPYVLKEFSEIIRVELDKTYFGDSDLFPKDKKLRKELREVIDKHIYRNSRIRIESVGNKKRLVMRINGDDFSLGSWSAGQKEFAPLLFGLYWLIPSSKVSTRNGVRYVTIEEPEMGMHPNAIIGIMLLVFELLNRGYKVNLSTHSDKILELIWGLNYLKKLNRKNGSKNSSQNKFLDIFELEKNKNTREFAQNCISKKIKVYYFKNNEDGNTEAKDISSLEVDSEDESENTWGELSLFSTKINDIVAGSINEF